METPTVISFAFEGKKQGRDRAVSPQSLQEPSLFKITETVKFNQ